MRHRCSETSFKLAHASHSEFKKHDILVSAISPTQIRMVIHLDVTEEMVLKTIEVIQNL